MYGGKGNPACKWRYPVAQQTLEGQTRKCTGTVVRTNAQLQTPQPLLTARPKCRGQHPTSSKTAQDNNSLQMTAIITDHSAPRASGIKVFLSNNRGYSRSVHISAISISTVSIPPFCSRASDPPLCATPATVQNLFPSATFRAFQTGEFRSPHRWRPSSSHSKGSWNFCSRIPLSLEALS
jgi:hypothetical protein